MCVGIKSMYVEGVIHNSAYLFDLRVDKDFQRRGIAKKLFEAAI